MYVSCIQKHISIQSTSKLAWHAWHAWQACLISSIIHTVKSRVLTRVTNLKIWFLGVFIYQMCF